MHSNCLWSRTRDWYSTWLASTVEPRTQPNFIRPSRSWPNKWREPLSSLQPQFRDKSCTALVQRLIKLQQRIAWCLSTLLKTSGQPCRNHCDFRRCPTSQVHRQSEFPRRTLSPQKQGTANGWEAWNPPTSRPGVMIVPTLFSVADITWTWQAHGMQDTRSHTPKMDWQ